jgi:hypothetical protein
VFAAECILNVTLVGLVTEYPVWFILFCVLLGAAYAAALYYRAKAEIPTWLVRVLTAFRFLSVFLISFLLLSPLIRQRVKNVEKPVIIIGSDNSQSLALGEDSLYYRKTYPGVIAGFVSRLEKKFDVQTFTFGEKARDGFESGFTDKITNISSFFSEIENRFAGRNVGAVILATDGIYNQGLNPLYASRNISWPVYTVVMGDTIQKRDILIRKVTYNREAFLGDRFPVEIMIEALKCNGEAATVRIMKGGELISEIPLRVSGDRYLRKVSTQLEAKDKGTQHYTVTVSPVNGEFTNINNRHDIFVEVLDERQKIAILYDAPHPDISALTQAMESGIRFEVHESEFSKFTDAPDKYDLVILYQIPSQSSIVPLDRFMQSKTSLLFVLGSRSDLFTFNNLKTGLAISSQKLSFSESQPVLNRSFPLFTVEKELEEAMNDYPPLVCPFGSYQSSTLSDILLFQKMGNVTTTFPMVIFFRDSERKVGVITGENIWRWRISNFISKGNHDSFNELVGKITMYLSVKGDKSFFRVTVKNTIPENEPVEVSAEVLNESYELINDPDVSFTVKDKSGKSYPFVLAKTGKDYYLNAGTFPAGDYTWEASVNVGNNRYTKNGTFGIAPVNLEALGLIADHPLLSQIANSHDGYATTPGGMQELAGKLLERSDIASVAHFSKRFSDLAGNIWLFLLIIALLTAEWAVRKRSGM